MGFVLAAGSYGDACFACALCNTGAWGRGGTVRRRVVGPGASSAYWQEGRSSIEGSSPELRAVIHNSCLGTTALCQ